MAPPFRVRAVPGCPKSIPHAYASQRHAERAINAGPSHRLRLRLAGALRPAGLLLLLLQLLCLSTCIAALSCERSHWEPRIDADLEQYEERGISAAMVDKAARSPCGGYLVSINNNTMHALPLGWEVEGVGPRPWPHPSLVMLAQVLCTYRDLPPVTFVINTFDRLCSESRLGLVPVLSWGKEMVGDDNQILVPYWLFLNQEHYLQGVDKGPPWEERREVAIWRGTATGGLYTGRNWQQYSRSQLVHACNHSKLCDAKITGFPQAWKGVEEAIRGGGGHGEPMSLEQLLQHKYVIVNDGNMAPSSRMFIFLRSGSTIFKQESPSVEFYYSDLKPFEHYIPVSYNFGNLETMVKWAIHHDRRAQEIARNALAYAEKYLTKEHIYCFMYRVLLRYGRAQKFSAGYHNESWRPVDVTC